MEKPVLLTDLNIGIIASVFLAALIAGKTFLLAAAITALVMVAIYGYVHGWWEWLAGHIVPWLRWLAAQLRRDEETAVSRNYDLRLGYDPISKVPDIENLADMGHIGVYGTTRFGKTTFLHSIIHDLIANHKPSDLRLLIVDPKEVDYPFYGSLPHLMQPIARNAEETAVLISALQSEMARRNRLFAPYARRAICNNLDRYAKLSGDRLPRILTIIDELTDVVQPGTKLEADLIGLTKLGLAYGIQFIFATQRPSSKIHSGEIKSQIGSRFVTWMPTAREYGVVAEIPREIYQAMPRVRGRFIVYTANGWRFMQANQIPDKTLERAARHYAGHPRRWPEADDQQSVADSRPPIWSRGIGDDDKMKMVRDYAAELSRKPTIAETMERFGISRPTAIKYRRQAWEGSN